MLTTGGGRPRGIAGVGSPRYGPGARAIGCRRRRSSPAASAMGAIWRMVRSWGPTPADGNNRLPDHPTRQRGAAFRAGTVENLSLEMFFEMLSPSPAAEVCGADRAVQRRGSPVTRSIRCSEYPCLPNRRPPVQTDPPFQSRTKIGQDKSKAWQRQTGGSGPVGRRR